MKTDMWRYEENHTLNGDNTITLMKYKHRYWELVTSTCHAWMAG